MLININFEFLSSLGKKSEKTGKNILHFPTFLFPYGCGLVSFWYTSKYLNILPCSAGSMSCDDIVPRPNRDEQGPSESRDNSCDVLNEAFLSIPGKKLAGTDFSGVAPVWKK